MFCDDCGGLLPASITHRKTTLICTVCGASCEDVSEKTIVSESKPSEFPSALRVKRSAVQAPIDGETVKDAEIEEPCDKCGTRLVRYYTQQLRGADEGSTVFYTCPNCGNKCVCLFQTVYLLRKLTDISDGTPIIETCWLYTY